MKITMAHGSGGKSSAQLMKDIFGKHFSNDVLNKMEDAAVLDIPGRIACRTDSFVVPPLPCAIVIFIFSSDWQFPTA